MDDRIATGDYLQLLRRGSVTRRLAASQHAGWRQALRAKARADDLRIRTWANEGGAQVWAVLPDWTLTREERERLARRLEWLRED